MATKLISRCVPGNGGSQPPAECNAAFTVEGIGGNQKLAAGGIVTLRAEDEQAERYLWEVAANPPTCEYLLTGATQRVARLSLPGPGAYVVGLTVRRGECTARCRVILWVATTCHLYRLPAASEALRFDGDPEWAGDLAKILQDADCYLPTPAQKAALDAARNPHQGNPFVTLADLPGGPNDPGHVLTDDEIAAIHQSQEPTAANPFITQRALPPPQLTPEQEAAIDAANQPNATNPFITQNALPEPQLTPDQEAAVDAAKEPSGNNPFITQRALPAPQLTPDQEAAVDAAEEPSGNNPFITQSALPEPQLTPEQEAAVDVAQNPNADNPFITQSALPPPQLTVDQEAAIDAAKEPSGNNPFITQSALPLPQLTPEQEAAIDAAKEPSANNPFITESALPPPQLTAEQEAAIDAAKEPSGNNPFITESALPPPQLTAEQEAAVDAAQQPSAANPFITQSALPPPQLTADQEAAIDAAKEPNASNPFLTQSAFPLSEEQVAAITGANAPTATNPFVTVTALPPPQLTIDQKAAIDAAQNPNGSNPFITQSALPPPPLTDDELAAIRAAQNPNGSNPVVTMSALVPLLLTPAQQAAIGAAANPNAGNPFITQSALPPPQLTEPQVAAIQGANDPGVHNPVATLADLGQAGTVSRVVAAGTLDLSGATPSKTLGKLAVLARQAAQGLAILSFATYRQDRAAYYVVKALPVTVNAREGLQALTVVQFVEFTAQGFVLQMVRPFANQKFALGPCMIEVSEIVSALDEAPDDDTLLEEDFTESGEGADPANWLDTGPENSLTELDLFKTAKVKEQLAFGTTNTEVNIHSHYVGPGAHQWTNYRFTGQLYLSDERGGVGITFFSQYPNADVYYRLRRYHAAEKPEAQYFHLAAHEHGERPVKGDAYSNINPADRTDKPWYNFQIEVADIGQRTNIRAKVWPEDGAEPADFSIVAYDDDPQKRLTAGTVGIWAMRRGDKYVRNLKVLRLAPDALENPPRTLRELVYDYYTLVQQENFDEAWLMLSDRFKTALGLETLAKYRREWQNSGPAFVLGFEEVTAAESSATLLLHLNYPKAAAGQAQKRFRYEFARDPQAGHKRFDHWLFMRGTAVT